VNTPTPTLTKDQEAAYSWIHDNWHNGLKLAGADSNYTAYHAFVAGWSQAKEAMKDPVSMLKRIHSVASAGLDIGGDVYTALNVARSEARTAIDEAEGRP